jgi:hypothetical protein
MSTAKLGYFDELLAITQPALHPILTRLSQIIREVKPDV